MFYLTNFFETLADPEFPYAELKNLYCYMNHNDSLRKLLCYWFIICSLWEGKPTALEKKNAFKNFHLKLIAILMHWMVPSFIDIENSTLLEIWEVAEGPVVPRMIILGR